MSKIKNKRDQDCATKTWEHKKYVARIMGKLATILFNKGMNHDDSKLEDPEFEIFAEMTPKLGKLEYDSDEYKACLEEMKPALDAHYANNDHHPEYFSNGIKDMTLINILEMFVDWYCSAKRQDAGNIRQSIEKNRERFGYSKELADIFVNTVPLLENLDDDK